MSSSASGRHLPTKSREWYEIRLRYPATSSMNRYIPDRGAPNPKNPRFETCQSPVTGMVRNKITISSHKFSMNRSDNPSRSRSPADPLDLNTGPRISLNFDRLPAKVFPSSRSNPVKYTVTPVVLKGPEVFGFIKRQGRLDQPPVQTITSHQCDGSCDQDSCRP